MKRLIILLQIVLAPIGSTAQELLFENKLSSLKKSDELTAVRVIGGKNKSEVIQRLKIENGKVLFSDSLSNTENFYLLQNEDQKGGNKKKMEKKIKRMNDVSTIEIRELNENTNLIIKNEFILQFKDTITQISIDDYFATHPYIFDINPDSYFPNRYLVSLLDFKGAKTIDNINQSTQDVRIDFMEGNVGEITNNSYYDRPLSVPDQVQQIAPEWPNDELLNVQWYLRNTGLPTGIRDADIKIFNGWKVSRGQNVTIAILDNGLEVDHPEFQGKVIDSYDAFLNSQIGKPLSTEYHGTACAGIAAALNDNGIGISGIAPEAKLLGVKIAKTPNSRIWNTDPATISRGLKWAADNNAKVINCSWGSGRGSKAISKAIQYAIEKGCIVVCSAGNNEGRIEFPASLSKDFAGVISVGASNNFNEFKTRFSNDGEKNWGSCFGDFLSIVAPGVGLATTDLLKERGCDANSDYAYMSGTSAASPIVSGAIALMLSKNPNLSAKEIKTYLAEFSDEVRHGNFKFKLLNIQKLLNGVISKN